MIGKRTAQRTAWLSLADVFRRSNRDDEYDDNH